MEHLLRISSFFLLLVVAGGHAAVSSEEYWHRVVPTTKIPEVIRQSLYPSAALKD
ncbi:hypothetical protein AMTR_s00059p00190970 [Amborella trichopoda]|uniref:BURP domain-containing protein n=1 Tax=Amborella trichopoda TaxID=13333 RepID=U5D612_AMBTC|nr:hypothetical protein AMTR_s00059p00190970 [Amborella trichopoda]